MNLIDKAISDFFAKITKRTNAGPWENYPKPSFVVIISRLGFVLAEFRSQLEP